jgi:hypothetical protein
MKIKRETPSDFHTCLPSQVMSLTIRYGDITVYEFLENFAGRRGIPGTADVYDERKRFKIAECNRDYVWNQTLKQGFIRDVLLNRPLPSFIFCNNELIDGGNRATTLWLFQNDRLLVDGRKFSDLTYEEVHGKWNTCKIPVTFIENATDEDRSELYEKYNQGIVLTFGQKLDNRRNMPLVRAVLSILMQPGYPESPVRQLIQRVWSQTFKLSPGRSEMTKVYKLLVTSMLGMAHYHSKWGLATRDLERVTDVDVSNLHEILTILREADPHGSIDPKRKKECFELFMAGILNDWWVLQNRDAFAQKWVRFFQMAYDQPTMRLLRNIRKHRPSGLDQNNAAQAISINVNDYIAGRFQGGNEDDGSDSD